MFKLFDIPKIIWPDANVTAAHTKDRLICIVLSSMRLLYEVWH